MTPGLKLFGWGAAEDGQLGAHLSDNRSIPLPQLIPTHSCGPIVRIACGYKHTLLLNQDGMVFSCGGNEYQQLGRNDDPSSFGQVKTLENHTIVDIACGAYHNAAISYTGRLYTWGCNSNGQLGREGDDSSIKVVRSLSGHHVIQASLGLEHSLVLTDTSYVFAFGANQWGQLGLGFRSENPVPVPQQLVSLSGLPIRYIRAGGSHSVVLTISGSLYAWGSNKLGQLGLGPIETASALIDSKQPRSSIDAAGAYSVPVPTMIRSMKGLEAVYVACGESHTVVLTRDGGVFTYGSNHFGQLGHGDNSKSIPFPRQVSDLMGSPVFQITCGRTHTLALVPTSGCVYAFGAGSEGQLGTNDLSGSLRPKIISGPWIASGSTPGTRKSNTEFSDSFIVTQIYSGGDHAMLLAGPSTPKSEVLAEDFRVWDPLSIQSISTLCPQYLGQLRDALSALPLPAPVYRSDSVRSSSSDSSHPLIQSDSGNSEHMMTAVSKLETVFSSLGCLSASCLKQDHFNVGRDKHSVDLDLAHDLQQQLFQLLSPKIVHRFITKLMERVLEPARPNYPGIETLRSFMVLAVSDLLNMPSKPSNSTLFPRSSTQSESSTSSNQHMAPLSEAGLSEHENGPYPVMMAGFQDPGMVLKAYAAAVNKLETAPSKIIDRWFAKMQPRYLKRLVVNLNDLIAYILSMQSFSSESQRKSREDGIRQALDLMKRLYQINESNHTPISLETFYIPIVKEKVNIDSAFVNWLRECESGGMRFFSFCDYPFIFDASTKARMLTIEARLSMHLAMTQAQETAFLETVMSPFYGTGFVGTSSPFFNVVVRRDNLIQDTLTYLTMANPSDLRKVLRVKFEGEEAVDEGGVMKEFFLLIMRDLLSPIYGMFRCYPESRMLWFSEMTMESDNVFLLVGILCGLAIYNSIIVDLSFPLAMFRKLLGDTPVLDDLKELDPIVGRSLQQLLDYEGEDFESAFCLTFALDIDFFGESRQVELIENGANVPVTQENKALYVEKYVDYVFNKSCEASYRAFERGFHQVCSGRTLSFFRPAELQALVVGSEVVNWNELRQNTDYQGVYWDKHPVIEWFWEVLLIEFSIEDKKKFLRFLTGCDRVPIVGFSSLK
ncbi:unnamed protein product [Calicophoron daubneyi]|uniref:HECT domain-containing protein n=1 Tax=Calicophoron daubneyi TaxID=300641 RepID=A0AAV2T8G7_CALDB